jgi:hypothetical protein
VKRNVWWAKWANAIALYLKDARNCGDVQFSVWVEWWMNLHRRLTSGTGKCNASMEPALRRDAQFRHIYQVRMGAHFCI